MATLASILGSGGATNLSYDAATREVRSDTGTDAVLTVADATNAGLMAAADFSRLAGIATGATANATDAQLRDRATHTGAQTAATISDFAAAVEATAAVAANTAKVTNATHTGEVTGAVVLTIANDAVTNAKLANMATATLKGRVTAAAGDPEDLTAAQVRTLLNVTETGQPVTDPAGNLRDIPVNNQDSAYTFVLLDRGRSVRKTNTTAYAYTIPLDATLDFQIGSAIDVTNDGTAGNVTITPTAGVTLIEGTTTGAFILVPGATRLLHKLAANRWRLK